MQISSDIQENLSTKHILCISYADISWAIKTLLHQTDCIFHSEAFYYFPLWKNFVVANSASAESWITKSPTLLSDQLITFINLIFLLISGPYLEWEARLLYEKVVHKRSDYKLFTCLHI